ncbi:hypothetical protein L288_03755 [Sphingobium quisquiliarum P25]|uniref:Uncharacterized protein n=2 Tax=Sphingobium quisquiliarum TaxID=538379 RepID=T0HCH9_9SPHN|nr:hypothetical protein L288_03755 [Sphingobium quisquiliarum P25]EZP74004.1 hypothetical protein BV96_00092 [Sphingomonas paucimobilis]
MAGNQQNAPSSQQPAEGRDDTPPPTPGSPRTEDRKDSKADGESSGKTEGHQ